jgi:quinol monooxygenase YgiN
MSITRINEFRANTGSGDTLRDLLKSFLPIIESSAGCLSCQLLQSQKDPNHIVMIEVWENVEAHQASLKSVPPEPFHEVKKLLAVPPTGEYYHS